MKGWKNTIPAAVSLVLFLTLISLSYAPTTRTVSADEPSGETQAGEPEGAKALFHNEGVTVSAAGQPDEKIAKTDSKKKAPTRVSKKEYMGVSYWIELVGNGGGISRVTADRTFRSGERIKLKIETNRNGYLYVINVGSTGKSHVLFPNPGVGNNYVTAWTPYDIPHNNLMRFDENPGEELLLVMLSPNPIDTPFAAPAYRPLLNEQETQQFTQLYQAKGAKDIVLETESVGIKQATYVVAPMSSLETNMMTMQIKLRHK